MSRSEKFTLKRAQKLHERKARYIEGHTLVEGVKIIKDIYKITPATIFIDSAQSNKLKAHIEHFGNRKGVHIVYLSPKEISQLSVTKKNQGIIGVYPFKIPREATAPESGNALLFINNQDPSNMGNIIRTAVWFGIKDLYLYQCVDPFNPKAIRSSVGSLFKIRFNAVKNLHEFLSSSNAKKIGITEKGQGLLSEHHFADDAIYIFGNEGSGIPADILNICDTKIQISGSGRIDSLNLQTSFAIFAYEMFRNSK